MEDDLDKYDADMFRIGAFSLMTLLGKVFLYPYETFKEYGLIGFCIYVIIAGVFFYAGLVLLLKGRDVYLNKSIKRRRKDVINK